MSNNPTTEAPKEIKGAVTDNTEKINYSIKLISPLNQGDDKEKKRVEQYNKVFRCHTPSE